MTRASSSRAGENHDADRSDHAMAAGEGEPPPLAQPVSGPLLDRLDGYRVVESADIGNENV